MKPKISSRTVGVLIVAAIATTACSSANTTDAEPTLFDPATSAKTDLEPTTKTAPVATTTPPAPTTTEPATPASTEPVTTVSPAPIELIDLVGVTIDEIGVSTVAPRGWTRTPGAGFSDGVSEFGFFAVLTSMATDPTLDDYESVDRIDAGGHTWHIYVADDGQMFHGLALTEIGDRTYGLVLTAPAHLAEHYLDNLVRPALEAFGAIELPDADRIEPANIDVDGRTVAYAAAGAGPVTVVFEAGLGNGMISWALVAPAVAEQARIFGYDRPGYGGSDLTDDPRDGAAIVAELRELLIETGHEPPYVLVGHSLGGMYVDLFARTHPDEVAGVVLVDSRHHEFSDRCLAKFSATECGIPSDAEAAAAPRPIREEWLGLTDTVQQLGEAPAFPEVPLAVIVAGIAEGPPSYVELWRQAQQDYADMVPGARLLVAERSDHGIPAQQPEIIIDAIIEILEGAS